MSADLEKSLVDAGAECVAGDLILNRVVMGRYRGGQFYPTDEGLMHTELPAQASPVAKEKVAGLPHAPKGKGKGKGKADKPADIPADIPADTPVDLAPPAPPADQPDVA